jgi:hypothetical protein
MGKCAGFWQEFSQFDDRACILALSQLLQRSEEEELSQMAAAVS